MSNKITLFTFIFVLLLSACKTKSDGSKPNVGGKAGELLIVIDDKPKASSGGVLLRKIMTQEYLGLPQIEQHFDLSVVPHRALSDFMKTYRNIIITEVSPKVKADTILFYNNLWAKPQGAARITAKDTASLKDLVERNEIRLMSFFNKTERERSIRYFKKYPNPELIKEIKNHWGVKITIPGSFKRNKSNDDFTWMAEQADWGSMGFFIYKVPYVGESSFSKEYLLNKRDSILKLYLPGPTEGSYMTTELNYPILYKQATINKIDVAEMRGLWKLQGDMMGGPFISHAHHLPEDNSVLVTEGYVYSPENPDKRDKIRQLEAIMYTIQKAK